MAEQTSLEGADRHDHWDAVYGRAAPTELGWYQPDPVVSLELIEAVGVAPGGAVIDVGGGGPEHCSGLPVARDDPSDLEQVLASDFDVVAMRREDPITPAGLTQPFSWVTARRKANRD